MSVLDHPQWLKRRRRQNNSSDKLGWAAGIMIAVGVFLCLAALLNI